MGLNKKTVDDINVKGLRVLCRCDFNVPLKDGKITDENRLVAALPTIKKLIADGGKVILCSHLGKVKTEEDKKTKTLAPVAVRLSELLGQEVKFAADPEVVGPNAKAAVEAMKDGDVILLENTRFRPEETKNGEAFSKDLASICDVFVNDAFGTAHRAHCSNVGVAGLVDTAVVGYLMQKEIDFLGNAVNTPERPFVAILGGAKVADKLNVISNLLEKCDTLIIGGGMAFTFLKAKGYEVGNSLVDDTKIDYCKEMMDKAEKLGKKLLLPIDTTIADGFPNPIDAEIAVEVVASDAIPADKEGLDIGTKTAELYADAVKSAKTVVWNGPMGVFENPILAKGTIAVAKSLAETDATTIIGGGDSAAAVNQLGFGDKMTHISTKIIAGNWKMNKTPSEAVALVNELKPLVANEDVDVVFCVPAIDIIPAMIAAKDSNICIGAENMYFEESGAYTGEISPNMLVDAGVKYVVLGHSERREYFAETDETVNKKVLKAFEHGITPIICCGETLTQRKQGIYLDWIRMQIKIAFQNVTADQAKTAVIAYEPIWAIGTGETATSDQAEEVCGAIRACIAEVYDEATAEAIRIQYGGSVNAGNAAELFAKPDIDGGLVGGASLKADFGKIVNYNK